MKTRWSLSLPPLWVSVNRKTSSHTRSSSHSWSTFSTFTLWSIFLALCCLVAPSLSHPYPFLYQRGNRYAYARNIRPLPCVAKGGDTGVCMFAWDCMKANGTHLGTCIDRFYFGSCCKLDSKKRPIKPEAVKPEEIIPEEDNIIIHTPSETLTVKPSFKPVKTETGKPEEGMDKPDMTGTGPIGTGIPEEEMVKPDMTESETTGTGMTGEGVVNPGMTEPGVTGPEITVTEISGPGLPEEGLIDTDIADSDIGTGISGTELPISEITDPEMTNPEIIEAGFPGPEMTVSVLNKPETVDVGEQVSENDQDLNGGSQSGMTGTDDGNSDMSGGNLIDSNIESVGVEGILIIETDIGSTGTGQKPDIEENEVNDVTTESNYNDESGIADTTESPESPGSYDNGDNSDPIAVIDENQITGDSAIIDDSSTESAGLPEMEPAFPIRPPTTDSPFYEEDEETVLPESFTTTFAPLTHPSETDDDIHSVTEDQNMSITVIPSAGKPVSSNYNKTDHETDDYIELTTFLPFVTDKIEQDNIIVNTEYITHDISSTATEPSKITIKPDNTKPGVSKPEVETATELTAVPEESTVLGVTDIIQLPGFPGINVIKPEKETTILPITVIPAAIKPTAKPTTKPEVEDTTEIKKPETKPPGDAESTTNKIDIAEFTDLVIISTTTESEKPLKPSNIIPEVPIKPITKPGTPVPEDSTDWVPIIFPGTTETPKPTVEKPVETSTEKNDTQVTPKPVEITEVETLEGAESTTIASLQDQENDIIARLNSSKYTEICGRPVYPTKRIVGGSDASFGEFPWQVSLRQWRSVTFLHKCGAALLNENWAVTAAHCVENVQPEQLLLRLGEFDLERANEPYTFLERKVQIIATHPQFDARTFEYDLALLRFYEPVNFLPNIIPICIPQDDYNFIGDTGYVSGWGRLYEDGPLPSIMQKVPVPVITNPECEAMYKVAGYVEHIPQIFICAGYEAGLKDSCEGDSGGPMVIQRDGVWNLAGVISWGIGCALPNQPGVYTRISAFREWIEKIIVF